MVTQWFRALLLSQFVLVKSYEYDFIVVGSGTGGIVASRLAEAKYNVLLIEAGPDDLTFNCTSCGTRLENGTYPSGWPLLYGNPSIDPVSWTQARTPSDIGQFWNYNQTELVGGYDISLQRNKILGGCSTQNGGAWTYGDYRDFDYVSQVLGCEGWGFDDILPYFKKLETYIGNGDGGTNGPVKIVQIPLDGDINVVRRFLFDLAVKAGYPPNPLVDHPDFSIHHGVMALHTALREWDGYPDQRGRIFNAFEMRQTTSQAYIRRIGIPSGYLTVWTDTMVQRVLFESDSSDEPAKAIGVEYWDENDTLTQIYCNKEVIASGGYVLSPQLLMLSGIGSEAELNEHNIPIIHVSDKIGRYGQDNLLIDIEFEVNETLRNIYDQANPKTMLPYNMSNRSAGVSIINASNVYETEITELYDSVRYQCDYGDKIRCLIETQLRSKNMTINLRSNDSRQYPNVYRYHFSDSSDWYRIIRDIREFRRIISFSDDGSVVREVIPGLNFSTDEELREYVINKARWAKHEVGTLGMGPNENDPVDLECSVNGVSNLRVVDASIWPLIRVAGTMSLTYMIGEKCAQHILNKYDSGSSESKWGRQEYILLFFIFGAIVIFALGVYFYCRKRGKTKSYQSMKADTPLVERNIL